ncbi:MAG: hypothetical protein AB7O24_03630 [Kofleriaceae bacterium]
MVPVGCSVVVHTSQSFSYPFAAPAARAMRTVAGGETETIDVTGTIARSMTTLPIEEYYYETDDSCDLLLRRRDEVFDTMTIDLVGVMEGDVVAIVDGENFRTGVMITAAGPCPQPDARTLTCAEPLQTCDDDVGGTAPPDPVVPEDDGAGGGCSTGSHRSAFGIVLVLALVGRARRRARSAVDVRSWATRSP